MIRNTTPLWNRQPVPRFPRLEQSAHYDAVVIGGGITGLSAAYFLKQAGKTVCLLERDRLADGDTGHTTAHLTAVTDLRLRELVGSFGKEQAALAWYAGYVALDLIEQNVREHAIDCDFQRVPAFLHAAIHGRRDETEELREEAALAQELGFDVEFVERAPIINKPGMRIRNQAKFHPSAYLAALAERIDGDGSTIHEQSEVSEIQDDPTTVLVNDQRISCDYVVIATHMPLVGKNSFSSATLFQSKLYPYSSYVVGGKLPRGASPQVCLWDTSEPYYYLRVDEGPDCDRVIFGGNDHKTGQIDDPDECYRKLEATLREVLPAAKVDCYWSGQVIGTNDGLPFIGETATRQFVATGFIGNGMTFGTIAGLMARDAMLQQENPWQELFSVDRKKIRGGAWEYIKENVDYPYYYVADRLKPKRSASTRSLKRGEGEILKVDGEKVACSRDEDGKLHKVSPYCSHMGCLVHWNQPEQTWDCPCHGSRFRADGSVIAGPAETPLERINRKKSKRV
jgi:glycine/D-amino acid oxidase-like deaminating enzyme/nitrite reductase/ring-hydroxylating ferredoxin subunit